MNGTFALKQFPTKVEEICHGNHWTAYNFPIPVGVDFSKNLLGNKQNSKKLRGSYRLLGMAAVQDIVMKLPFTLPKSAINWVTQMGSIMYSNVPSPTTPYNFGGHKCDEISVFLPSAGTCRLGIIATSHAKTTKLGMMCNPA